MPTASLTRPGILFHSINTKDQWQQFCLVYLNTLPLNGTSFFKNFVDAVKVRLPWVSKMEAHCTCGVDGHFSLGHKCSFWLFFSPSAKRKRFELFFDYKTINNFNRNTAQKMKTDKGPLILNKFLELGKLQNFGCEANSNIKVWVWIE